MTFRYLALLLPLSIAACEPASPPPARTVEAPAAAATTARAPREPRGAPPVVREARGSLPAALVHKSPTCGCCTAWVEHLRRHGFTVTVNETDALEPIRKRLGVPAGKGSCHTAEIGGFVVEGHVPAADVERLLALRDGTRGLTVPGMPLGSPGMEVPSGQVSPYTVEAFDGEGRLRPFARHGEGQAL